MTVSKDRRKVSDKPADAAKGRKDAAERQVQRGRERSSSANCRSCSATR